MRAPIGIGFLSFAHGHVSVYAEVMKHFGDVRLVAAYDDSEERGRGVCDSCGMRYTPHVEDILDNKDIQAVIVGSETSRHAELCVAAAAAGKHILCQKPMAFSLDDCDRMITAADQAGVVLAVAYQMRHDPANIKMREIVQSGELGPIAVIRRRHCIGVLLSEAFISGPSRWHIQADKNMGMFMDDASHPADWFYWMLGRPVSVIAEIDNVITHVAPDDNGVAVYRFQHGEMGILFNSSTVVVGENTTEIYGKNGCVIQNYGDAPSCWPPKCPEGPAVKMFKYDEQNWRAFDIPIPADQGVRIRAVPRPWVDSLIKETPPVVDGRSGRVSVEMVLGAYKAAREGRRVTFPL